MTGKPLPGIVRSGGGTMQPERVAALLRSVGWGRRPAEQIAREMAASLCFGVFLPQPAGTERQVGFARVVLDSAGTYHLCDVVIEEALRGRGLGTKLVQAVTGDQRLQGRFGTLETGDAHRFYERLGFERCGLERMHRRPDNADAGRK